MVWNWLKSWFKPSGDEGGGGAQLPEIPWIAEDANPWGVPLLDLRPVALGMLSTSKDKECAINAMSFGQDDGLGFDGVEPEVSDTVPASLRFRIDGMLADGALFIPSEMEHKWALYYHRSQVLCIRSWTRAVAAVADVRATGDHVEITAIRGALVGDDPALMPRVLDFLLRSHALGQVYPAPLPTGLEAQPQTAALWCFSLFGNLAHFATPHELPFSVPEKPLRTHSLLHIAVARGDSSAAQGQLQRGIPLDLRAGDGLCPLHWAIARDDTAMLAFLIDRGSPVDVRSDEGATPLMNAVQARSLEKVAFLLDRGADPNATDQRGFTALHRAAEMGQLEVVRLLLDRGAAPHPEAQGHTPRSLAQGRGETAVVELLDSR
jgi:hypothetical protein